jgi:hypothetical protein
MRILSVKLETVVPVGHPAYRENAGVRSFEKSSELHIEDAELAFACYDQLDSLLDLDYLNGLVQEAEEPETLPNLEAFDQGAYDRAITNMFGLPIGSAPKIHFSEFRLVLQIEQIDVDGHVFCTYGPEPAVLFETDDADDAIEAFNNRLSQVSS